MEMSRRELGAHSLASVLAHTAQLPGQRPPPRPTGVEILNPRARVPISFIIDDSTCLVNLAHYCIPQFAHVFPDQYKQDWRTLPREIPDDFVRKFADWCEAHGVKGKYSIVPHPACVGWVDTEMPGWTRKELEQSVELVRTRMMPSWDIHPEMVTHTRIIDTKTGKPYPEYTQRYMENWRWTDGRSTDEIANYLAYALQVLNRAGLPCEGITTPGGFGNRALPQLAQATLESVRSVFNAEIPHYFRHLFTDEQSVAPRVEYVSGLGTPNPRCVVSIIGCTGDWFGGWDGLEKGKPDQCITADGKGGRLPEVIKRGEPAILVCHWPGIYFNGQEHGFNVFKEVVRRLERHHPTLIWMKLSEIARYWAAKELTFIRMEGQKCILQAPYSCPGFTLQLPWNGVKQLSLHQREINQLRSSKVLTSGSWRTNGNKVEVCFDLPKGDSTLFWA